MQKKLRIIALTLLFFLGIGALVCGWALMSDPSGKNLQFTVDMLDPTPFSGFFIPGMILFIANGIFSMAIAVLTILKVKNYAWLIIVQGCILTGWLTFEIIWKMFYPILHYPYYIIGILLIVIGFIINKYSKKRLITL